MIMVYRITNNKIIWLLYKGFQCLTTESFFEATVKRSVSLLTIENTDVVYTASNCSTFAEY